METCCRSTFAIYASYKELRVQARWKYASGLAAKNPSIQPMRRAAIKSRMKRGEGRLLGVCNCCQRHLRCGWLSRPIHLLLV